MGTPSFAVPALKAIHDSKHQICAVVTNPDKRSGRGQKYSSSDIKNIAQDLKYPIFQPNKLNDPKFITKKR